ncbi:hypothetical protein [Clostridium thermarum]|nr:hypothetical protein [Clostridium thermarum]
MYDAKKEEENEDSTLYETIYDRGYFDRVRAETLLNTKTGYVPNESIGIE